jgi:hypothetical protein
MVHSSRLGNPARQGIQGGSMRESAWQLPRRIDFFTAKAPRAPSQNDGTWRWKDRQWVLNGSQLESSWRVWGLGGSNPTTVAEILTQ